MLFRRRSDPNGESFVPNGESFAPGLGRFAKMQKLGPHDKTTPKEVVEYLVTKLRQGEISEAFTYTCIPVAKRGCHRSSTVWTRRMAWDKAREIGGAPSGLAHESTEFEEMIRSAYAPLLQTEGYRFIGDASNWQMKDGVESPTDPKEYIVEVKTQNGEHLLVKFRLIYDWLLYCHLVATVGLASLSSNAFPGSEDIDLDI